MIKRFFDFLLSLVLLLILCPIYIVVVLLILFKIGRPVFFRQKRPGVSGKIFNIYKFRTMTVEKDEGGELLPDEQRLTSVGMYIRSASLDELPQILNVLKGDMSFVGPRPLLIEYLSLYSEKQSRRHEVKPGITGWAQVNGRNAISWEEKFDLDVWYVDNQSIWLDIKILWLTIKKVILRDGISQNDHVTMDKFKGSL
jgi:lipopolysaccharide/colanic/teichoic acid biosynthesis glycosyltransferase